MAIIMFDSINVEVLPEGPYAYAGYVGGYWPTYPELEKKFPHSELLSIAIIASENAECLDIEAGDAVYSQAAAWAKEQASKGVYRPVLYSSVGNMGNVMSNLSHAGIGLSTVRLWSAHYQQGQHICGPATCRQTTRAMDGTQWTDTARGISLDQSELLANFFAPKPDPADWTYGPPQHLTAKPGHTNVELNWKPPTGAPTPPAEYQVYIYRGNVCDVHTLVPSYNPPRVSKTLTLTGGSLHERNLYTAHVVAAGPNGTRVEPHTYASVEFTTGY